ncbi:MAG TPA: AAA family ATPase [Caulobacteraceae bacterium]|nr:AAA family ATPase [Caulobacteraceae bacterium]
MSEEAELEAWLEAQSDRVIETSCAHVYLTGARALKLKRRVDYGFLDFSTLERRRWALDRELAFNRRTAPDIYRAVRRVTHEGEGYAFDGAGPVVDYVLEMRRFDPDAVLSNCPEKVDGDLAERLGRQVAAMHAAAPVRPEGGGVKALGFTIRTNAEHLRVFAPRLGKAETLKLIEQTDAAFAAAGPMLEARRSAGFARHVHGDLHLGNILLENGEPVLFDCIEFNDLLSEIDIQYDLAFLLMDLGFRSRADAANRVLGAYLDEAARHFPDSLWEGLALLPLMQAVRAGVRAHVSASQDEDDLARRYVQAGLAHFAPPPPVLMAIGGVSGTGKTTLARMIAPRFGAAPGALVLRSDEVRKRLFGFGPTEHVPREAYGPDGVQRAYDAMLAEARQVLAAGRSVILDATFLSPENRDRAAGLAKTSGVPFAGVWLTAPTAVLKARIGARYGDASDATVNTLHRQLARGPGALDWPSYDASDLEAAAKVVRAAMSAG